MKVVMSSIMGRMDVKSSREILIRADCLAENVDYDNAKMIVLPGGRSGVDNLGKNNLVKEKCKVFAEKKYVAAVCASPSILAGLGLLDGKKATVHPDYEGMMNGAILTNEPVTVDNNVITGKGLGATIPFALKLIEQFKGEEVANNIANAICYK